MNRQTMSLNSLAPTMSSGFVDYHDQRDFKAGSSNTDDSRRPDQDIDVFGYHSKQCFRLRENGRHTKRRVSSPHPARHRISYDDDEANSGSSAFPRNQVTRIKDGIRVYAIVNAITNHRRHSCPGLLPNQGSPPSPANFERPVLAKKNKKLLQPQVDNEIEMGFFGSIGSACGGHSMDTDMYMDKDNQPQRPKRKDNCVCQHLPRLSATSGDTYTPSLYTDLSESVLDRGPILPTDDQLREGDEPNQDQHVYPKVEEWINNNPSDSSSHITEVDHNCSVSMHDYAVELNKDTLTLPQCSSAFELTVNTEEDEPENTNNEMPNDSCYVVTSNWFTSILVAFTILGCLTLNKVCLLAVGRALVPPANTTNTTLPIPLDKKGYKESVVVMLVIILMIPQGFSMLAGFLSARKSQPWPKRSAIKWIVVGGIVESSCLCYLCIYAITILSSTPHIFLLFMSGLFIAPTMCQVYESTKKGNKTDGNRRTCMLVLAVVSQIGGVALLYIMNRETSIRDQFEISFAIFILSVAWSSKARKSQMKSSKEKHTYRICRHAYSYTTVPAGEKAALLLSVVHLIVTPLASLIVCLAFQTVDLRYIGEGFRLINSSHPVFYFFLAQIFLTFFGYHAAWFASSKDAQRGASTLPLVLASPLALVFIELKSVCDTSFIPVACGPQKGPDLYCFIGASVLLLLGQFLSTEYYLLITEPRRYTDAFRLQHFYIGALLEPFILLNRRRKFIRRSQAQQN